MKTVKKIGFIIGGLMVMVAIMLLSKSIMPLVTTIAGFVIIGGPGMLKLPVKQVKKLNLPALKFPVRTKS